MKNVIDMNEFYKEKECGGFEYITERTLPNYKANNKKLQVVEQVGAIIGELAEMENAPVFEIITHGFAAEDGDALVCIEVPLPISVYDINVREALAKIMKLVDFTHITLSEDGTALRIVLDIDGAYTRIK